MESCDNSSLAVASVLSEHGVVEQSFQEFFTKKDVPASSNSIVHPNLMLSAIPFPHCLIRDLLADSASVSDLEEAVLSMDFTEKNNDLYKFHQSKALDENDNSSIMAFRRVLEYIRNWIGRVCDIKMGKQIDMFAAKYAYTDTLLCHDDELEGRRFAYIYYLVPEDWSIKDGGSLDLFNMDSETVQPTDICKNLIPKRNSLALFEVTEKSFHQVAEVLSESKLRLSLSGWFHGPGVSRRPHIPELMIPRSGPADIDEESLYTSINQQYLAPETQGDIQETFGDDSEILLTDFLSEDFFKELCEEMKNDSIVWESKGPAIKRRYDVAVRSSLPKSILQCLDLLTSDAMFLILSNLTGLKLHPLAADESSSDEDDTGCSSQKKPKIEKTTLGGGNTSKCKACVAFEVRRWSHGCYTLIHDTDMEQGQEYALDAVIHFNSEGWEQSQGGFTSYIAKGDDEELLQVEPHDNCLALVYRDTESLRFVKHINDKIKHKNHPFIYDINLVYSEE